MRLGVHAPVAAACAPFAAAKSARSMGRLPQTRVRHRCARVHEVRWSTPRDRVHQQPRCGEAHPLSPGLAERARVLREGSGSASARAWPSDSEHSDEVGSLRRAQSPRNESPDPRNLVTTTTVVACANSVARAPRRELQNTGCRSYPRSPRAGKKPLRPAPGRIPSSPTRVANSNVHSGL
jgi:hypothetical protein